jgi:hypothetical protein
MSKSGTIEQVTPKSKTDLVIAGYRDALPKARATNAWENADAMKWTFYTTER